MLILYLAGLVALLGLTNHRAYKNVYVDENALMVGNVQLQSAFNHHQQVSRHFDHIAHMNDTAVLRYVDEQLAKLSNVKVSATKEYLQAVIWAKRSDGTECLVLTMPASAHLSVAVALILVKEVLLQATYMHKNVMLLIYCEQKQVRDFIEQYNSGANGQIVRAGAIVSALGMDFRSREFTALQLEYVADNGLLPNMDMCATLLTIATDTIHIQVRMGNDTDSQGGQHSLMRNLVRHLVTQFKSGVQSRNIVAPMVKYRVEAATLYGHDEDGARKYGARELLSLTEHYLRAMNNLLERLHHSSSLYILLDTRSFVPIAHYMAVIGLMSASLVAVVFNLWQQSGDKKHGVDELWPLYSVREKQFMQPFAVLVAAFTGGLLIYATGLLIPRAALWITLIAYLAIIVIGRALLKPQGGPTNATTALEPRKVLLCMTILIVVISMASLSVINFALAMVLLAIHTPLLLVINHRYSAKDASNVIDTKPGMMLKSAAVSVIQLWNTGGLYAYAFAISPALLMLSLHFVEQLPWSSMLQVVSSRDTQQLREMALQLSDFFSAQVHQLQSIEFANASHHVNTLRTSITSGVLTYFVQLQDTIELLVTEYKQGGIILWPVVTLLWLPVSMLCLVLLARM